MRASDRISGARQGRFRSLVIYGLLFVGAALFSWPLAWMFLASLKTEKELTSETSGGLPEAPHPRRQSPYIDSSWYPAPTSPAARALLPAIEQHLRSMQPSSDPAWAEPDAVPTVARGLVRRLSLSQAAAWWNEPTTHQSADLPRLVTPALAGEVLAQVERSLELGQFSARSYDLSDDVLASPAQQAAAWRVEGPGRAGFVAAQPGHSPTRLAYDLSAGDVRLTSTFTTRFPVDRLHKLTLYFRGDASWNRVNLVVEMQGRRLRSVQPVSLADGRWVEVSWQEQGPDDLSNKVRTWTLLKEEARSSGFEHDPHRLKITVELERPSLAGAWKDKLGQNYRMILNYIPFGRYVATSLLLVTLQLIGTLFSCSLTAYSFARLKWPGRRLCYLLMVATMIVPSQVTIIPHFILMRWLGWYNTLYPLWIGSFFANAFFVFLLLQFLKGIPRDLEDAALIDGCGYWRIYWHVILPLIRPSLATIAIFTFIGAWNDFSGPLVYLSDQRLYPLSFGLYALNIQAGGVMGIMMAGSLLMTLPVIAIFFFAQRYFIQGITLTGMK